MIVLLIVIVKTYLLGSLISMAIVLLDLKLNENITLYIREVRDYYDKHPTAISNITYGDIIHMGILSWLPVFVIAILLIKETILRGFVKLYKYL